MIYTQKPEGFRADFEVVGCYVKHQDELLLLLRAEGKKQANARGVPAWKVDEGEDLADAALRELKEETWIQLEKNQIFFGETLYTVLEYASFLYHIYHADVSAEERPAVVVNSNEHKEFVRVAPEKALEHPLMTNEDFCIKRVFGL